MREPPYDDVGRLHDAGPAVELSRVVVASGQFELGRSVSESSHLAPLDCLLIAADQVVVLPTQVADQPQRSCVTSRETPGQLQSGFSGAEERLVRDQDP